MSIVPVNAEALGTVKLIAVAVESPRTTFDPLPETVQFAPMVGEVLFLMLKI